MRPNTELLCGAIDAETRCQHYHGRLDIIAIKFKCCGTFYPCFLCHNEASDHEVVRWSETEFEQEAILCGACGAHLSIREYLSALALCPQCGVKFNPNCAKHWGIYFEIP